MFDRFLDEDSPKRREISREVERGAKAIKMDEDGNLSSKKIFNKELFGICYDCKKFRGAVTKYGNAYAWCWEFETKLNASDPVVKCSEYEKRGGLTLFEMKDMATLIEVDKKEKAGFVHHE